jgi:endonuclease/exonuclease/phosphatase family metal-dependent hydrolase
VTRRVVAVGVAVGALVLSVVALSLLGPGGGRPDRAGTEPGRGSSERPAPTSSSAPTSRATTYTLLQMNLCLSGLAGCFEATAYPAVLDEAVERIRAVGPDAVTVTEACRRDAVQLARRVGYHVRFARVIYAGAPLPCIDPTDRGVFGDAVLTTAPIVGFETHAFAAQSDLEERRWLCATTRGGVDVCTAHLETPHTTAAAAARDAQCAELATVLAARTSRAYVFGGDVNQRASCAPAGAWSLADGSADQAPGIQHAYGSAALRDPVAEVLANRFSDHDMLVARATLGSAG